MGHVHYKGDFARTFAAPAHSLDDEAAVDCEIARLARSMRPQLRIPKPIIWALLASIIGHSAVAIALSASNVSAPTVATTQVFQAPRTISLDWDLYAGDSSSAAAAAGALEEEQAEEEQQVEDVVAVAAATPRHERSTRSNDAAEPVKDEPINEVPMAPVAALVDDGSSTRVEIPTGEQTGAASRQLAADQSQGAQSAEASSPAQAGTPAREASRSAGANGDGQGVDLDGVRRGHIASLNRAIRSKNPCTRELSHRGLSGDVIVGLTQRADGSIDEVRVLRSSGESLIDDAAKDFIRNQSRLPSPSSHLAGEVWQVGLRFQCSN